MSTQTLASASSMMSVALLVDTINVYDVGDLVTSGINTSRSLTKKTDEPIRALVQTTVLANAVESTVNSTYSIKVEVGTALEAGQAVQVVSCQQEPDLVGKTLLIDKISENGLALIRKAVASDFYRVDQQGKEAIKP